MPDLNETSGEVLESKRPWRWPMKLAGLDLSGERSTAIYLMKKLLRLSYWQVHKYFDGYGLARFRAVRYAERLVRSALRSDYAEVLGHRMYLDPKDSADLSINSIYEP